MANYQQCRSALLDLLQPESPSLQLHRPFKESPSLGGPPTQLMCSRMLTPPRFHGLRQLAFHLQANHGGHRQLPQALCISRRGNFGPPIMACVSRKCFLHGQCSPPRLLITPEDEAPTSALRRRERVRSSPKFGLACACLSGITARSKLILSLSAMILVAC